MCDLCRWKIQLSKLVGNQLNEGCALCIQRPYKIVGYQLHQFLGRQRKNMERLCGSYLPQSSWCFIKTIFHYYPEENKFLAQKAEITSRLSYTITESIYDQLGTLSYYRDNTSFFYINSALISRQNQTGKKKDPTFIQP